MLSLPVARAMGRPMGQALRRSSGDSLAGLLFSASEPGFTFEPWDITTLYQDRAGTTPVTAVGQSVGLRLSKDQGLRIGPELVTNGDFSSAAGWTLGAGWSISGGALNGATGAFSEAWTGFTTTAGKTYRVTISVSHSAGGILLYVSNGGNVQINSSGTFTILLIAGTSGNRLSIGGQTFTGSIDNISVRELAGNHEVAINDAARGVYGREPEGGTRNRLTYTEQFDNAAWFNGNTTVTANTVAAPDGLTTADTLTFAAIANANLQPTAAISVTTGQQYTYSVYIRAASAVSNIKISMQGSDTAIPVTTEWQRVTRTVTASGTTLSPTLVTRDAVATAVYIWGAQLELGASATAYQKVVSQYDVTEAGVPTCYYVQTDGVDDAYVTPTITPNTDKVQVFAGVRRLLSSSYYPIIETSAIFDSNSGSMTLGTTTSWIFASKGSLSTIAGSADSTPSTKLLTGLGDISGDSAILRLNGIQVSISAADQGTGNFLAYPAYIYARGGTSLPFNGRDYGHAVRFGPNLDAATIARVEALIARNTPTVTL